MRRYQLSSAFLIAAILLCVPTGHSPVGSVTAAQSHNDKKESSTSVNTNTGVRRKDSFGQLQDTRSGCGMLRDAVFRAFPTIENDDLCELIGYTILACSTVEGEFEGADFNKRVRLDNGMTFEFQEYDYTYAYRPDALVFAKDFDADSRKRLQDKGVPDWQARSYRLLVEDTLYDVIRVR